MSRNIIELLIYLFEVYSIGESDLEQPQVLKDVYLELKREGFEEETIETGVQWLRFVSQITASLKPQSADATRVFHSFEREKIDQECIDLIYFLEDSEVLNPQTRELLIDSLLHLNADNIDTDDLQWLALIILFYQPEQELAYATMQSLMFDLPVEDETLY